MTYRPAFDGIRGVAIAMVVWHHLGIDGVPRVLGGFLGVDAFFVLSGYLITALLVTEHKDTGRIRPSAFWARRALRILPALAPFLAVAGLVAASSPAGAGAFARNAALVLGGVANWRIDGLGVLTHTWSLAIEEQFYLVWPLVLLALWRRVDRRVLVVALAIVVCLLAGLAAMLGEVPPRPLSLAGRVVIETYTRGAGIVLGCIVALVPAIGRAVRPAGVGVAAAVAALAIAGVHRDPLTFHYRGGTIAFTLAVAIALAHVVHAPNGALGRALGWRPLIALGRISYGLYLFHVPVIVWMQWHGPVAPGIGLGAIAAACSVAIAVASWVVVEQPMLRRKSRFAAGPGQIARASTAE